VPTLIPFEDPFNFRAEEFLDDLSSSTLLATRTLQIIHHMSITTPSLSGDRYVIDVRIVHFHGLVEILNR